MQIYTATPQDIVNATINAFNKQDSVEKYKSLAPIDKARFLANDALYVDVMPYSLFYRMSVALAASVDKEQTKGLFGLSDIQIDAITKRAQSSLETGHEKTWNVFNQIERTAKKDGYAVPELAQIKAPAQDNKPEVIRRPYNPAHVIPLAKPQTDFRATATPPAIKPAAKITETKIFKPSSAFKASMAIKRRAKPAADMAKAAAQLDGDKPQTQRKKRSELTLGNHITSLTIPKIVEACIKLHDEMGLGLVSIEELTSRKYATPNAISLREFAAYTAYRVLPFANYSLERIATGVFMTDDPVKSALEKMQKKIGMQDKGTTTFLHGLGDKLGLTDYQKNLLFVPQKPRFKSWYELQELAGVKAPSPSRNPEAP